MARLILNIAAAILVTAMVAPPAPAQNVQRPDAGAAKGGKDTQAAERALEAGEKAAEAGKTSEAVKSLSAALAAGGLSSQNVAKALYLRGAAYRKQGQPALAVSDLTSAIWLKNGLSEPDRASAEENRVAALRESGAGDDAKASATPASAASFAVKDGAEPASQWQTTASKPDSGAGEAPRLAVAAKEEPPEKNAAQSGSNSTLGGFFSNLFSSSPPPAEPTPSQSAPPRQAALAEQPPAVTASVASPEDAAGEALPWAGTAPAEPAVSSWSERTEVTTTKPISVKARAANTVPTSRVSKASTGSFQLKVPSMKSEPEARALAGRLAKEQGLEPRVEKKVYGAMGTFFSVEIGPFASDGTPRALCETLKSEGVDCLVTR